MNIKRTTILAAMALLAVVVVASTYFATTSVENVAVGDTRQLPTPTKSAKMTLMESLQNRHSSKEFSTKEVSEADLAELLWAACGINRPESKKITAPSAINAQDINVYVCTKDGAWLYIADGNMLKKVSDKDLRLSIAKGQEAMASAPLFLVLSSDHTKFGKLSDRADVMGAIDSGYVSQNICLACTALGLATRPRMSMDKETLAKELQLDENHSLLLNHPVGYEK